jgi:hypothetical protein
VTSPLLPTTLYELREDFALPTELTRGPWSNDFQHAGPPAALLSRALDRVALIDPGRCTRLSFDILRPIPVAPLRIRARTLRPGRSVELLESELVHEEEVVMRCTAWRMRTEATPLAEPDPPPPLPEPSEEVELSWWTEPVAYHRALEWRRISGDVLSPGPAAVWTRLGVRLVQDEEPTALQRLLVMADAASGVSAALDWTRWTFMNVDLGIHLERAPEGEWMAMDAVTRPGLDGTGMCTSVLYDRRGRVGVTTQSLLISER